MIHSPHYVKFTMAGRDPLKVFILFIWVLTSLSTHCIGHIMMGSFMGRPNQYIQLVKVLYCKPPTNSKQRPAFPLQVGLGFELWSQRWEVRVLPLCHLGPWPLKVRQSQEYLFQFYTKGDQRLLIITKIANAKRIFHKSRAKKWFSTGELHILSWMSYFLF